MMQRWEEFRCSPLGHILGLNVDCASDIVVGAAAAEPEIPPTGWRALDRRVALRLYRLRSPRLDWIMRRSTDIASGQTTVPIAVALVAWQVRRDRPKSARAIAITWIGGLMLHVGVKLIYRRKRPTLFPAITRAGGYSMPSGHTVTAVVTYGLAASAVRPYLPRIWRWMPASVATVICGMVGTSRVYLGVHYPSDVLAGATLGLVWLRGSLATLARLEKEYLERGWKDRAHRMTDRLRAH
jgi:membrane-associated phospholipid phosphatase